MASFIWPIRIYYEDTDSGGIVYHANYLKFMERGRTEWLRHAGFEQDHLRDELELLFVVRSLQVDYFKPAVFNDVVEVVTHVRPPRHASLLFEQEIRRASGQTWERLCHAKVKVACLHAQSMRPVAIPDAITTEITDVG